MLKVICMLLSLSTFAASDVADKLILAKEKQLLAEMKAKKLSDQEIYEAYLSAGDEFTFSNEHRWASYFYGKASKFPVKDKLGARLREIGALLAIAEDKKARELFPEAERDFKSRPRSDKDRARLLLYKILVSEQLHDEVLSKEELAFIHNSGEDFGGLKQHDVKVLLKRGNFDEVVKLYEGQNLARANVDEKILVDLAGTLAGKKLKERLLCQDQYEEYPLSRESSYTMTICGMLLKIREKKKPSQQDYQRARAIIESKFPQNSHLLPILKGLL